jgi:hypothetical protein
MTIVAMFGVFDRLGVNRGRAVVFRSENHQLMLFEDVSYEGIRAPAALPVAAANTVLPVILHSGSTHTSSQLRYLERSGNYEPRCVYTFSHICDNGGPFDTVSKWCKSTPQPSEIDAFVSRFSSRAYFQALDELAAWAILAAANVPDATKECGRRETQLRAVVADELTNKEFIEYPEVLARLSICFLE